MSNPHSERAHQEFSVLRVKVRFAGLNVQSSMIDNRVVAAIV
jgi:hypothetical protein